MGKNWKGRGGGGGGGGGGDFTNCRGFACVIGTCDAAREKESNKELTNLLNQAIERVYPPTSSASVEPEPLAAKEESIADMLQNELKQFRQQKHSGAQDIVTINTGIKGIVFAKISRRDVCPVKLVKAIMDQIRDEKVPCSRHLVKMIPLQLAFYGGETEFMNSAKILAEACFTGEDTSVTLPTLQLSKVVHKRKSDQIEGAESEDQKPEDHDDQDSKRVCQEGDAQDVPEPQEPTAASFNMFSAPAATEAAALSAEVGTENSAPGAVQALPTPAASTVAAPLKPEIRYFILFKARNHNTLNKHMVIQRVRECLPAHLRQDYLHGQVLACPLCVLGAYLQRLLMRVGTHCCLWCVWCVWPWLCLARTSIWQLTTVGCRA
jgi:hypothetical protein